MSPRRSTPQDRNDNAHRLWTSTDAKPGDTIILQVCEEEWGDWPSRRCFDVDWTAPKEWNADAVRSIIRTVFLAVGEREDAHLKHATESIGRRAYFWLQFGRYQRTNDREVYVQKNVPFLTFNGAGKRYQVTLPKFPYAAIAAFIETEHSASFTVGPVNIFRDWPGPSPRYIPTPRKRTRRPKKAARRVGKGGVR